MKKYKICLLLVVLIIWLIPIKSNAANQVIDANEMEVFQKTKQEIQEKWKGAELKLPEGSDTIFEEEQSYVAPYNGGVVKQEYLDNVQANLNYYRYLTGSPEITETPQNREDLQAATVVQTLSLRAGNALTHYLDTVFSKPEDMTDEFYNLGVDASHNIVSSYSYGAPVFPFFDESYFISTSGHRTALLAPTIYEADFGLGNVTYGDTSGSSSNYDKMAGAIAAYPSPGYFPKQDFADQSDWDIYLNPNDFNNLTLEEMKNIVITIKSVEKNETYTYTADSGNLYISNTLIHMKQPPKDNYYNGDYEVHVTNLKNSNGEFVDLKYTIKFFDKYEGIQSTIYEVEYEGDIDQFSIDGEYNEELLRAIMPKKATINLESGSVIEAKISDYDVIDKGEQYFYYEYSYIPKIIDFPTWAEDTYGILAEGIRVAVYENENRYYYEYEKDSYLAEEGEDLSISVTYTGPYEEYSNFNWYKEKDGKIEALENGTKYEIDKTNLTIKDFNENDEANYYVVNDTDVYYMASGTSTYVSKSIKALLKPDAIKGDVNYDGKVALYDAFQILRQVILGEDALTDDEKYIMDYNDDGKVGLYDAFQFLRQVILS